MPPIASVSVDGVPQPLPADLPVLDVREQHEWDAAHIEGALHVPLMEVPGRLADLPATQVLVVCKVGGRSGQAVAYLSELGYDVVNLVGGMVAWEAAGRPMVSETGRPPEVV